MFNIATLVVIVATTLVCPPAGIGLGIAYGTYELSPAVAGKDLVSGRELGTGERWFRGLLSPFDIVPGVAGIKKFSDAARTVKVERDRKKHENLNVVSFLSFFILLKDATKVDRKTFKRLRIQLS